MMMEAEEEEDEEEEKEKQKYVLRGKLLRGAIESVIPSYIYILLVGDCFQL